MQTIDLIILGMVIEKSQSAYDIQKDIEYHNFDRWSKISIPSIYKKVIQLENAGYLSCEIVNSGRLKNKAIYSITDKGKIYFQNLMNDLSMSNPSIIFDFNILIANITKLTKPQGQAVLSNLKIAISNAFHLTQEWENEYCNMPFNGKAIIKQQIAVYKLLLDWVNEFEKQYTSQ